MKIEITLHPRFGLKWPKLRLFFNEEKIFDGTCAPRHKELFNFDFDVDERNLKSENTIKIEHYDKQGQDTIVNENGEILSDRAIILKSISLDGLKIPELVLFAHPFHVIKTEKQKTRETGIPEKIENNLYFGYNGFYQYKFGLDARKHYYESLLTKEKLSNVGNTKTMSLPDGSVVESFEFLGKKVSSTQDTEITIEELYEQIKE